MVYYTGRDVGIDLLLTLNSETKIYHIYKRNLKLVIIISVQTLLITQTSHSSDT